MNILVQSIQFLPNRNAVAVLCEFENMPPAFYINLRESDLPPEWMDADVLDAAQAKLDTDPDGEFPKYGKQGHTLVLPPVE